MKESVSRDFITIFEGSPAEAQVLRVALEARGIHTYLANQFVKSIDPFITGVGMFDLALQVPQNEAAEAINAVTEIRVSKREAVEPHASDDLEVSLERLGRSLRWGAILVIAAAAVPIVEWVAIAVFALFYVKYVVSTVRLGIEPRAHSLTLLSAVIVIAFSAVVLTLAMDSF